MQQDLRILHWHVF